MAVVKANAYGHGDVQVARTALEAGAQYLAVAFLDEALSLRSKGITAPIIILGATPVQYVAIAAKENITVTVYEKKWLEDAAAILKEKQLSLSVHVKCDTGMGRIGVRSIEELQEVVKCLAENQVFRFEGIYTHFATADELDEHYFQQQVKLFQKMLASLKVKPKIVHSSNSAAALRFRDVHFTAIRFGIAMYGLTPSIEMQNILPFPLQPALSFHSTISYVKQVPANTKISYGSIYQTGKDEWIGTIPVGYADGWFRKLTGQSVLVNGERMPIIGRICMDQFMIRLKNNIESGTKVTLIGKNGADFISAEEIADKLETINYEVVCSISNRVPRVYIKNGEVVEVCNGILQ